MMRLTELITEMEQIAPTRYAESWDNVGLLLGDKERFFLIGHKWRRSGEIQDISRFQAAEGHFVGLWNRFPQRESVRKARAGGETLGIDNDGDGHQGRLKSEGSSLKGT